MSEQLNIIINGKNVTGFKGEYILDVAVKNNIEIPTLCNDSRLEPYTSCYMCVVEVEGMRGLQPACSTRIMEGMKITTDNPKIRKARKTALDLLLSNHYADCMGPCKQTCPAGVDVQGYISLIEKKMYNEAVALIKETNPLPAICGRVCVRPCEVACRRNLLDEGAPVGIDYLKRFTSDMDLSSATKYVPQIKPKTNKKVAVIGAGPGGLSAAFFMQKEGHQVDIYEASPKAGGWLRYGIPEYRLPNDLLQKEVDNITDLGVNIFYNQKLGDNISFAELKKKYDALILAIGCQKGTSIGCEGDDAENVISGIDFLKAMELSGKKYDFKGKTVAVIGGGNTAMDCCRTSLRCGADKVYVIYRRTEKEMPANPIEIHESKLEGVEYMFLTAPVKVNKDKQGRLKSLTCIKMVLGEPDASGRRRPVPVKGSEFEVVMDIALAAIGQKTLADFLTDINKNSEEGEVKTNKWGDLDANPDTLQTGVKNIFACGDGVTGAATLIQAVAQARIAANSCHHYLHDMPVVPLKKEFISKKENFKEQVKEDYEGRFYKQLRHEMPTLPPDKRRNFNEVELGYENEDVALKETERCLECGCTEFFTCDLKRYATEYDADQKHYEGEFKEYLTDFRHPYIEIDNNKCILCSRCVRICKEVVGANALGLVNRGFKTYVAPSMGDSLTETSCESCGLCISTCPTGAITENVIFKPGPVKLESFKTICNYCSVGCEINIHHKNGFVMKVTGSNGNVNKDGNICRFAKFGYLYLNDKSRITKPLLNENGTFKEISFEQARKLIAEKIKSVQPEQNAFFAGARLTNEEMYLIKKLASTVVKSENIGSFHYLGRGDGYFRSSFENVPFQDFSKAGKFYLLGSEINMDNAVAGFLINTSKVPVELITVKEKSSMAEKVTKTSVIKDYYFFVKAVNYYLLKNNKFNRMYINDNCKDFEEYAKALLAEDYKALLEKGSCCQECLESFADGFNENMNAVLVFSEKEISGNTAYELYNLALLTGKLGKTAMGIVSLKEKNNAQGLFDMGFIHPMYEALHKGKYANLFIYGEDPVGCAIDKAMMSEILGKSGFIMVQDYFMTETARAADLIMPASLPFEIGGTFTNTQRYIQKFHAALINKPVPEVNSYGQLCQIISNFTEQKIMDCDEIFSEFVSMLPLADKTIRSFVKTGSDNTNRMFYYGCDNVVKSFMEDFNKKLQLK
ncbi:MAG: FAD-dependent oxidoreductase [Bacteroidales bacterium]|jgi:formate dehydrogenase major subunit|nr:FAD-dependent oxidoreductase [Bacteroidales bacterium]